ncbi:hypothetical protein D3C75_852550 [compost metagenome]
MTTDTPDHSQTAAITLAQLAAIAGRDPSYFSLHKDQLPKPVPVRDGTPGRPQVAYSLEQLAALVLDRTGHLDDSICRLRLALSGYLQPAEKFEADMANMKITGSFRIVTNAQGEHVVVPLDLNCLAPHDRAEAEDALAYEAATRIDPVNRRTYTAKDHRHE